MNEFRAVTGLENEFGARVEAGALVPPGFVPDWQMQHWLENGDVVEIVRINLSDGVDDAEAQAAGKALNLRRKEKHG